MPIALLSGIIVLVGAMVLAHLPLETLWHPAGWFLVLGGTLCAVLVSFSPQQVRAALGEAFRLKLDKRNKATLIEDLVDISRFVRQRGSLALQPLLDDLKESQPYLGKGLAALSDNTPADIVNDTLTTELELRYREGLEKARLLESAGGYAPTMGLMGALLGLMQTVQGFQNQLNLHDLGVGVAGAFSATLLGIALANLLLLPLAAKLKERARQQWLNDLLVLQTIQSIQAGEHPLGLQQKLNAYLRGEAPSKVKETKTDSHFTEADASPELDLVH